MVLGTGSNEHALDDLLLFLDLESHDLQSTNWSNRCDDNEQIPRSALGNLAAKISLHLASLHPAAA